jgi:predicted lipoprotein with Yx(FWY)xxD motif
MVGGGAVTGRGRAWAARTATAGAVCLATGLGAAGCSHDYVGGASVTTVGSASSATVDVKVVKGIGRVLVTSSGRSLYLLTADPKGASVCIGSCQIVWPPLLVSGRLKAGPGVDPRLLSTLKRSGGAAQVMYAQHPLYTFEQDAGPGMAQGEGIATYGGVWWLVSPAGRPVSRGPLR